MDLVPLWSADVLTNSSGMASVTYTADDGHGVLIVNVGPVADEFLIGGDVQDNLIVMTECSISVSLVPYPPAVDSLINITFLVTDDLGEHVDGISIAVSAYDPYGQQIQLGRFTNSITVSVEQGLAIVEFTPEMVGLYTVSFTSTGSVSVHGFTDSTIHTIYSSMLDHDGSPMVGRNVTLNLDGPGASSMGPMELITNATGFVTWNVNIAEEGLWILDAFFEGLGVYLPSSDSEEINVKYGTVIQLEILNPDDVIAGVSDASFSILIEDNGGTPLEGFTVHYEAHHQVFGLIIEGDLIQTGTEPMILNITLDQMGNITFVVSFSGTSHYHQSNSAIQFWVRGTTEVVSSLPTAIDRSSEEGFKLFIEDEVSDPIPFSGLVIVIEITGQQGIIDLTSRLLWNETSVDLYINSLPVGHYTLSVTVASSIERVGCEFVH